MIKSKKGYKISVLLSIVCWLTFIWLRTFTYMASYDEGTGAYSFLIFAVITLLGTFFYWSLLKPAGNGSWFSILFDDEPADVRRRRKQCEDDEFRKKQSQDVVP